MSLGQGFGNGHRVEWHLLLATSPVVGLSETNEFLVVAEIAKRGAPTNVDHTLSRWEHAREQTSVTFGTRGMHTVGVLKEDTVWIHG